MHALASLFDESISNAVRGLWSRLEAACGLTGIQQTPIPHFSWLVAETLDFLALEQLMEQVAGDALAFSAATSGVGVFTGTRPVLYVPVLRNEPMIRLQRKLWAAAEPLSRGLSPHYAPDVWMPHITLAHDGLDPQALACAVGLFAQEDLNWLIRVDNLALIYQEPGAVGKMRYRVAFGA